MYLTALKMIISPSRWYGSLHGLQYYWKDCNTACLEKIRAKGENWTVVDCRMMYG